MIRFVILAAPRTGSNLLCTLLQSHASILCHHELFNPDGIFYALGLRNTKFSLGSIDFRNAHPTAFLEHVWSENGGHECVGFKMTHRQHLEAFKTICADPTVYKIVLKRKAVLKTYVSRLIAEKSGVWEDYKKAPPSQISRQINVDYTHLKEAITLNETYYQHLKSVITGPRMNVAYEDLGHDDTHRSLLAFLQQPYTPLLAKSRPQNPHPVKKLISNKQQLEKRLNENTEDSALLNELNHDNGDVHSLNHLTVVPLSDVISKENVSIK